MKPSIFEYRDYRQYLHDWIGSGPRRGHGLRSQMARAMSCQLGYVSQILSGKAGLSLEQGDALNRFLGHTREEAAFLLLLVQFERAGTASLRKHFGDQIDAQLLRRVEERMQKRPDPRRELSAADEAKYYDTWYLPAIHSMIEVPRYQTPEAIASHLGLALRQVNEALEFLVSVGLARRERGRFKSESARTFFRGRTPFRDRMLVNWRLKAIGALDRSLEENAHYSGLMALSREDAIRIKALLVTHIEEIKARSKASDPEAIHCLSLDFFKV